MKKKSKENLLIRNKKAEFSYDVIEKLEAGIVLTGAEAKAIRSNKVDFSGSFIKPVGGEMYVINLHIDVPEGDSRKTRKLLLNKREILNLSLKTKQQKLTLIPLALYTTGRLIKLELGLVRGKKSFEKRSSLKKKDIERELEEEFKGTN